VGVLGRCGRGLFRFGLPSSSRLAFEQGSRMFTSFLSILQGSACVGYAHATISWRLSTPKEFPDFPSMHRLVGAFSWQLFEQNLANF